MSIDQINCCIVDDDLLSIEVLKSMVERVPFLNLVETFTEPSKALLFIEKEKPELLFLDVEMPEMSGLDLLAALNHKPQVVISSQKDYYAFSSYQQGVIDYLLKPVSDYSRFLKAAVKAKNNIEQYGSKTDQYDSINANYLFIKVDSFFINVSFNDIALIEAYGDYVKLYTTDGKRHIVFCSVKKIEEKLPMKDYIRIHRSYLARIDKIEKIDLSSAIVIGKSVPVSRRNRQNLLDKINTL